MGFPNELMVESYHVEAAKRGSERLLKLLKKHHGPKPSRKTRLSDIEPDSVDLRVDDIKRAAAIYFNVSPIEIDSGDTSLAISYSRHVAMYLARSLTKKTTTEIGRCIGGRDHTTILHGSKKISRLVKSDWTVAFDVAHVEAML
jgi:chromosomal replication initiation ATPase DnaA